jgi:DNA-binding response OmpR family regulator
MSPFSKEDDSMARILVVDDDAPVRSFLRIVLERAGHQVLEAADGDEGLHYFREHQLDLMILDIFMPMLDGIEVLHDLRLAGESVKAIVISGGPEGRLRDHLPFNKMLRALEVLKSLKTLRKPFDPDALLAAVNEVLGERKRWAF